MPLYLSAILLQSLSQSHYLLQLVVSYLQLKSLQVDSQVNLRLIKLLTRVSLLKLSLRSHQYNVIVLELCLTSLCNRSRQLLGVIFFSVELRLFVPVDPNVIQL